MKKYTLLTVLFLAFSFMGIAQEWHGITSDSPVKMKTTLVSSSENEIVVDVNLGGFFAQAVSTPEGTQYVISVDKMASMLEAGAPDLPMQPVPVVIGDLAEMKVNVMKSEYVDIENFEVAPSKGNISRQVNPADVAYTYGAMYQQDAFWPATQAYLEKPYILRDFRGQNIMVRPFAYNPVTKTLRVYTNMTLSMTKVSDNGENQKIARKSNSIKMSDEVKAQYSHRFINFDETNSRYVFDADEGEMLIICADSYMNNMQPLVDWKNKSGRPTTMVSVSTAGGNNVDNIKNYVSNFYNDPAHNLEYLLFVGDYSDITPKNYGSGSGGTCYSDNFFGKLEGNDDYLEVLVGRFSVGNATDVNTQVNKVLYYERDVTANDSWLDKGLGIGHMTDGTGSTTGHYGEADYQHIDFIRDTLMHYTYTGVTELHGGSGGSASTTTISNTVNQGVGIINYCNHGSVTSWGVASYSNSDVNALTNDYKLPVVWSVACLNGKFDENCFAEAWLRAKNNTSGVPTGAVGGMFSFVSQPWQPPMYGQDEMVDILTGWRSVDKFHHTLGGASLNGSMYVLDMAPNDSYQTFNTWILFGDPSMMMRTAIPGDMNVTANPSVLMIGMSELNVMADAEYAIATLSMDGEVLASTQIVNGQGTLTFPALSNVGAAELVILGYNKETYMGSIDVVPAEGAYITVNSSEMSSPANYGETVDMSIEFKNVGVETANNISVTLSTDNEFINITSAEGTVASLGANATATVEGFQFEVAENAVDGTKAQLDVTMTDGTSTWMGKVIIELHAPVVVMSALTANNQVATFTIANDGSAPFHGGEMTITSCSPDLVFDPETIVISEDVAGGETVTLTSGYSFAESVEDGTCYDVAYNFMTGLFTLDGIFRVAYGTVGEDFESGIFGSNWSMTPVENAWTIIDGGTKGTKCAKSTNEGLNNTDYSAIYNVNIMAEGEITFMYMVSSEVSSWGSTMYDYLKFELDGQEKGKWGGTTMTAFEQFSTHVTPGQHELKWTYHKDGSVDSGSDCAWIDDITIPATNIVTFITPATDLVATVVAHDVTLTWVGTPTAEAYIVKRNGVEIATVTDTQCSDYLEVSGTYNYTVTVRDAAGQMSAPASTTVAVDFTGIEENALNIGIYPNPATDVLNVMTNALSFDYQIVNSIGQVVMSGTANNNAELNVSDLDNGVYFIKIVANGNTKIEKVIIK